MKSRIVENSNNNFKPVTVEVTFETKEEFLNVYWRLNLIKGNISDTYDNKVLIKNDYSLFLNDLEKIYDTLD